MPKSHTYHVSFSPAERQDWGGYTINLSMMSGGTRHVVEASSFASLEEQVRKLAQAYGRTCSPYVRLADRNARKPAGFDAWDKTINIIEYVAPPVAADVAPGWLSVEA